MEKIELEKIGMVNAFLGKHGVKKKSSSLYVLQQLFIDNLNARPLVGVRGEVGGFTAETYIYRVEKSTVAKPCWERVFSPFSFNTYDEALLQSLMQVVDHYDPD